ncbi:hypothetical protein Btru_020800 [Bulinus truncatus]|nr:hypothetical protein Btru_020800 [Bulinus truncatus]
MGLKVLYNMVNIFLGDVVHKEDSSSYFNLTEIITNKNYKAFEDWKSLLDYFIGNAVCIAIGIILIIVMTLTGLIFCCCRCCGKCGGKSKLHETKHSRCKRRCFCTVLVLLNTLALAGVICAFLCNYLTYKHLQNDDGQGSVGTISGAVNDVEKFINSSVYNVSDYVTVTFDVTSKGILKNINDSAYGSVDDVLEKLNVQGLLNQAKIVSAEANKTREDLDLVASLLSNLSSEGSKLSSNLTQIKSDVQKMCQNCSLSGYSTEANFSTLDFMSKETEKVKDSLAMYTYIYQAEKEIQDAKNNLHTEMEQKTKDASNAINKIKTSLNDAMNELIKEKKDLLQHFPDITNFLNDIDRNSKDYIKIVYYVGIGICCAYLLIVVLYYIGILFGLCGERPGKDSPCCNTGTGSNFLMAGVGFTFLFFWILMIICTVMFAVGGIAYTEVCRNFDGHDPSKLKGVNDFLVNQLKQNVYENAPPDFSFVKILQNCQNNQALYSALQLDYVVDLDKYADIQPLQKEIDKFLSANFNLSDITILSDELLDKMLNFTSALENINVTMYFAELDKNLTVASLTQLAATLYNVSAKDQSQDPSVAQSLNASAEQLLLLDRTSIPLMRTNVKNVQDLVKSLNESQKDFNSNKSTLISDSVRKLANRVLNTANNTINSVKRELRENLVRCAPLTDALYTATDAACIMVLNPVNGLWFSFGWVLISFILCIIFAVLLTDQYRVQHKYEKEFDDPNFMYGGSNYDTMPLTSVDQTNGGSGSQPYRMAVSNEGYRHDYKRGPEGYLPPSYDERMRYEMSPPPKYNGHQSHDLSPSYAGPHNNGGGKHYSYPY